MATEEDQKPSHQLYRLQIKSTTSVRQTLCLWNILKDTESSHKRTGSGFSFLLSFSIAEVVDFITINSI